MTEIQTIDGGQKDACLRRANIENKKNIAEKEMKTYCLHCVKLNKAA